MNKRCFYTSIVQSRYHIRGTKPQEPYIHYIDPYLRKVLRYPRWLRSDLKFEVQEPVLSKKEYLKIKMKIIAKIAKKATEQIQAEEDRRIIKFLKKVA